MIKRIAVLLMCMSLLCLEMACADITKCPHLRRQVIDTYDHLSVYPEAHVYEIIQSYICYDCGYAVRDELVSAHAEGHIYDDPLQEHDEGYDYITYECEVCSYRLQRVVECAGPPCNIIYWSLRP